MGNVRGGKRLFVPVVRLERSILNGKSTNRHIWEQFSTRVDVRRLSCLWLREDFFAAVAISLTLTHLASMEGSADALPRREVLRDATRGSHAGRGTLRRLYFA